MAEITVRRDYLRNDYSSDGEGATQQWRHVAEAVHLAVYRGDRRQRLEQVNVVGFRVFVSVTDTERHSQLFSAVKHSDDVSFFDGDFLPFWHNKSVKVGGVHSEVHFVLSNELVPAKPCIEHLRDKEQNYYGCKSRL